MSFERVGKLMARKALFVFAHQDDEHAYVIRMRDLVSEGWKVHVIWRTDGARLVPFETRKGESVSAMRMIRLDERNLHFLGYPDGNSVFCQENS